MVLCLAASVAAAGAVGAAVAAAAVVLRRLRALTALAGGSLRPLGTGAAFARGFPGVASGLVGLSGRFASLTGRGLTALDGISEVVHPFAAGVPGTAAGTAGTAAAAAAGFPGRRASAVRPGIPPAGFPLFLPGTEDIRRNAPRGAGIPGCGGHPVNVHGSAAAVGDSLAGRLPHAGALVVIRTTGTATAELVSSSHHVHLPSQYRLCRPRCFCYSPAAVVNSAGCRAGKWENLYVFNGNSLLFSGNPLY